MKQHVHFKKVKATRVTNVSGQRVYLLNGHEYLSQRDIRSDTYIGKIVSTEQTVDEKEITN